MIQWLAELVFGKFVTLIRDVKIGYREIIIEENRNVSYSMCFFLFSSYLLIKNGIGSLRT